MIGDTFTQLSTTLKTLVAPAIIKILEAAQGASKGESKVDIFFRKVFKNLRSGQSVVDSFANAKTEIADEKAIKDSKDAARLAATRAARRAAENTSPNFASDDPGFGKASASGKGRGAYSDSLLAVGNFLGSGAGLGGVADKQLEISKQSLQVQRGILQAVGQNNSLIVGI